MPDDERVRNKKNTAIPVEEGNVSVSAHMWFPTPSPVSVLVSSI
jgi:hypothetical protein